MTQHNASSLVVITQENYESLLSKVMNGKLFYPSHPLDTFLSEAFDEKQQAQNVIYKWLNMLPTVFVFGMAKVLVQKT